MSLVLERSDAFRKDFALQALWYVRQAGGEISRRCQGDSGRHPPTAFPRTKPGPDTPLPSAQAARRARVRGAAPLRRVVIFYRVNGEVLQVWRLLHGARNLPRRLLETPGSAGE